jgi:hypothetical protein
MNWEAVIEFPKMKVAVATREGRVSGIRYLPPATAVKAPANELAERAEYAERLARTDALTGLADRRTFEQMLELELARATRLSTPLALATPLGHSTTLASGRSIKKRVSGRRSTRPMKTSRQSNATLTHVEPAHESSCYRGSCLVGRVSRRNPPSPRAESYYRP